MMPLRAGQMAVGIGRREFVAGLGGSAVAWPLAARAQQPTGRMSHIAYLGGLSPTTLDPRQIEQFKVGLAENGLVEGQNITVDYLWGWTPSCGTSRPMYRPSSTSISSSTTTPLTSIPKSMCRTFRYNNGKITDAGPLLLEHFRRLENHSPVRALQSRK